MPKEKKHMTHNYQCTLTNGDLGPHGDQYTTVIYITTQTLYMLMKLLQFWDVLLSYEIILANTYGLVSNGSGGRGAARKYFQLLHGSVPVSHDSLDMKYIRCLNQYDINRYAYI